MAGHARVALAVSYYSRSLMLETKFGIVPAVLERLSDIDRPDDLARAAGVSRKR
jgi:hypothetical protein